MVRTTLQALAVAAIAVLPLAASAQYSPNTGDTLLASQTVLTGTLEQSLNSRSSQVGDPFVLDVIPPFPGDDQRYNGAKIYGHVQSVQHASNMKRGGLTLAFDRLTLMDGTTASLQGSVLSYDAKSGGNAGARGLAGGIVGQIVGNYLGKHIGTDIGGAVGAIGGALYASSLGTNVTIGQGSQVAMKTTAPSTVLSRRQAGQPAPPYH